MPSFVSKFRTLFLLWMLLMISGGGLLLAQQSGDASGESDNGGDSSSDNSGNDSSGADSSASSQKSPSSSSQSSQKSGVSTSGSTGQNGSQGQDLGHLPLPPDNSGDSSLQVAPPSVVLPTPALPAPWQSLDSNAVPGASPLPGTTPTPDESPAPQASPPPVFTPPSGQSLNLPSAQSPGGNSTFAPASSGLPSMSLEDSAEGPGFLGGIFDWAKKLRFQAAVRMGFDNNVNSSSGPYTVTVPILTIVTNPPTFTTNRVLYIAPPIEQYKTIVTTNPPIVTGKYSLTKVKVTNTVISSPFVNLNGGVNYRFGTPRLSINMDLTGGVTRYFNSSITKPLQGTLGFGLNVNYRFSPKLVFTFDSSSSYQEQPNITLAGTANSANNNAAYYYSANSLSAAYQWSDLLTSVARFNLTTSYYPANNNANGFSQPGFTESIRYLIRPTTTAVFDYNADAYTYQNSTNNSVGQSVDVGFDHTFNPKWFWNFRLGAEARTSQNSPFYLGPYFDSNFSWAFQKVSSIAWVLHYGTQPSGQNGTSYSATLRTGLSYTQGIFTRLKLNLGLYYLYNTFPNGDVVPSINSAGLPVFTNESYTQSNIQGNIDLAYQINRIFDFSIGYQYITQSTPKISSQDYNRGTTYLQFRGGF